MPSAFQKKKAETFPAGDTTLVFLAGEDLHVSTVSAFVWTRFRSDGPTSCPWSRIAVWSYPDLQKTLKILSGHLKPRAFLIVSGKFETHCAEIFVILWSFVRTDWTIAWDMLTALVTWSSTLSERIISLIVWISLIEMAVQRYPERSQSTTLVLPSWIWLTSL